VTNNIKRFTDPLGICVVVQFLWPLLSHSLGGSTRKCGALRDDDVLLFVCLSVCQFVTRHTEPISFTVFALRLHISRRATVAPIGVKFFHIDKLDFQRRFKTKCMASRTSEILFANRSRHVYIFWFMIGNWVTTDWL